MQFRNLSMCLGLLAIGCAPTEANRNRDASVDVDARSDEDGGVPDAGKDALVEDTGCSDCTMDGMVTSTECSTDQDCTGNNVCVDDRCVACRVNTDCPAETSVCVAGACVACSGDNDCTRFPLQPACVAGACQGCTSNNDCGPNASVCNLTNHRCEACKSDGAASATDTDCAHLAATPVCLNQQCVACTGAKRSSCGNYVCNALTHACETGDAKNLVNGSNVCEACVSDAQCQVGQACVKQTWQESADAPVQDVGWFCTWIKNGGGGAPQICGNELPYVVQRNNVSIEGSQNTTCELRSSSCPAVSRYASTCGRYGTGSSSVVVANIQDPALMGRTVSASEVVPDSAICQLGGRCLPAVPEDGAYRCSTRCQVAEDCDVPDACDQRVESARYCGVQ